MANNPHEGYEGVRRAAKRVAGRAFSRAQAAGEELEGIATKTGRAVEEAIRRGDSVAKGQPFPPTSKIYRLNIVRKAASTMSKSMGPLVGAVVESGAVNKRLNEDPKLREMVEKRYGKRGK